MALDGTYDGLKASVADFLNRGDLGAVCGDFIRLAEGQINTRLKVRRMIIRASTTVVSEFCQLPSDFNGPLSVALSTGEVLDCMAADALTETKRCSGGLTGGTPRAYAVVGSQFQFWPAPADGTEVDLTYYAKLPALSADNPTNWLLTDRPDVYLYGALLQSAPYLQDDARLSVWAELFTTLVADLQLADAHESQGARLTPRASQVA